MTETLTLYKSDKRSLFCLLTDRNNIMFLADRIYPMEATPKIQPMPRACKFVSATSKPAGPQHTYTSSRPMRTTDSPRGSAGWRHCRTGQYLGWTTSRLTAKCWRCHCAGAASFPRQKRQQEISSAVTVSSPRFDRPLHKLPRTTDVGRRTPNPAEEDAQSEASEGNREEAGGRAEVEERSRFFPTPSFTASAEEDEEASRQAAMPIAAVSTRKRRSRAGLCVTR